MKIFSCSCETEQPLYFDNDHCETCGCAVGFDPQALQMRRVKDAPQGDGSLVDDDGRPWRHCANRIEFQVCNWLVAADDPEPLCCACRTNEVIPDLSEPLNRTYWARLEAAKRRALYGLMALGLPLGPTGDTGPLLRFRFMADTRPDTGFTEPLPGEQPVYTGHDSGTITINLAEADEVARTRTRLAMAERYRTLLGHFRHELGHYYWELLVLPDGARMATFRELFGDPDLDYAEAQKRHYGRDAHEDNPDFISHYATMHPWEDWAESWAHYLHVMDTLETASSLELRVHGRGFSERLLPHDGNDASAPLERLIPRWLRLAEAMNMLNRSMGMPDAYPFVLTAPVQHKLDWIHELVMASRTAA